MPCWAVYVFGESGVTSSYPRLPSTVDVTETLSESALNSSRISVGTVMGAVFESSTEVAEFEFAASSDVLFVTGGVSGWF